MGARTILAGVTGRGLLARAHEQMLLAKIVRAPQDFDVLSSFSHVAESARLW